MSLYLLAIGHIGYQQERLGRPPDGAGHQPTMFDILTALIRERIRNH